VAVVIWFEAYPKKWMAALVFGGYCCGGFPSDGRKRLAAAESRA